MTSHDDDPSLPFGELVGEAELELLLHSLAETMLKTGVPSHLVGEYPAIPGGLQPARFDIMLNPNVVRKIFFEDNSAIQPLAESSVEYLLPHRINDSLGDPIYEDLAVVCSVAFEGTDVTCQQRYWIRCKDGHYLGMALTDYERGGDWISPNDVDHAVKHLSPESDVLGYIEDISALDRSFVSSDAEKLRQLNAVLSRQANA